MASTCPSRDRRCFILYEFKRLASVAEVTLEGYFLLFFLSALLEGFNGIFQADGSDGYNSPRAAPRNRKSSQRPAGIGGGFHRICVSINTSPLSVAR